VGRKRIDVLLLNIPDILEIYKTKSREQMKRMIVQVEGFSDIMAEKIVKNLKYADQLITKLGKYATFREEKRVSDNLVGQKFVMSGFRDKELEQSITERGGQVTGTVTGKTSGLILQQKTDKLTGKPEKAQQLGIPIYSRDEFIQKFLR
jgi:NAD-dependent DNA ligase